MITFSMRATEQVDLTVGALKDKRGNMVPIDGAATVESLETETITVEVHPDGSPDKYLIKAVGPVDSAAIVQVSADAKPGSEVEAFVENIAFEITAGVPVSFSVSLGTAEEQAEPPPVTARKKKSKK